MHVEPREVRSHVELAGVARRAHVFGCAEKFELIAEIHRMTPPGKKLRPARTRFAIDFD